jgi:phosphatidylglycerol lysyltransferase
VPPDQTAQVLALLKQHGRQATSFQVLEPGLQYWFDGADACVAYCEVGSAWVTAGEPICATERMPEVAARFAAHAFDSARRIRFFYVSEAFCAHNQLRCTHVGEEPSWNPQHWQQTLTSSKSLREQLRRARAKGVTVREVPGEDLGCATHPLRVQCDALVQRWKDARGMHELKFMVHVQPFAFPLSSPFFSAKAGFSKT